MRTYREALELVGIMESDTEILDRLFSMFDKTGNDQINYKEFVGGLAPLCHGTVEEKLACEHLFSTIIHVIQRKPVRAATKLLLLVLS